MLNSNNSDDATDSTSAEAVVSSDHGPNSAYEVGYGRPPTHSRFKPGISGNPKGRLAGQLNAKTTVARVINEKITVREGSKTRKISKLEALLQAHTMKALKGDARSANIVLSVAKQMGLLADNESETSAATLPEEDAAILKDFVCRSGGSAPCNPKNEPEQL